MVKILTNNNDATCLSLTHEEVVFYKSFLTLPKSKWSKNQNNTYNQSQTIPNNIVNTTTIATARRIKIRRKRKRKEMSPAVYENYKSMLKLFINGDEIQQANIYYNDSFVSRVKKHLKYMFTIASKSNKTISKAICKQFKIKPNTSIDSSNECIRVFDLAGIHFELYQKHTVHLSASVETEDSKNHENYSNYGNFGDYGNNFGNYRRNNHATINNISDDKIDHKHDDNNSDNNSNNSKHKNKHIHIHHQVSITEMDD